MEFTGLNYAKIARTDGLDGTYSIGNWRRPSEVQKNVSVNLQIAPLYYIILGMFIIFGYRYLKAVGDKIVAL